MGERPHLGNHARNWPRWRIWLAHAREHRTGHYNDAHRWEHRADLGGEERAVLEPRGPREDYQRMHAPGWVRALRFAGMWGGGFLLVLVLADPAASKRVVLALAPLVLALGVAVAGVMLARRYRKQTSSLANRIARKRQHKTARAVRAARQHANRQTHAQAQAARDEAKKREREARREANRDAHRRLSDDF